MGYGSFFKANHSRKTLIQIGPNFGEETSWRDLPAGRGVSEQSYYRCQREYGGLKVD